MNMNIILYADWFIPQAIRNTGPEAVLRSRLLVIASFVLTAFALPFLALVYELEGDMSPTAWSFVSGIFLLLLNPFLLRRTGSYLLPGLLFSCELIAHFAVMSYHNGGFSAASLVWNPIIPLLATLVIGPKFGLVCALLVEAETFAFYFLDSIGYVFPQPLSVEQIRIFHVAGSVAVIVFIGIIAKTYEQLHQVTMTLAAKTFISSRRNERYFRALIENTSDFISILDKQGFIRYVNPAHERGLGYRYEELLGKNAWELLHPEDATHLSRIFQDSLSVPGVLPRLEFRFLAQDGTWRILEATADNLLQDPAVQGVIVTSRDITERKQVERLKDELVSTVSHELRTPLTSLRGFTELMLTRDLARDQQRKFLEIIQGESIRLTNLLNDFLDIQRLESGRQAYNFSPTPLEALIREVAAIHIPDTGPHAFVAEFPDQLPRVRADADRLRQVLSNLISNAIKYSPNGGRITVGAHSHEEKVIVWVADQGMGIPAEAVSHLFTKFFRVDNGDTRKIGGTGLGLALVKNIVGAHGGEVWVESTEGVGSTFFFTLPVAPPSTVVVNQEPALL